MGKRKSEFKTNSSVRVWLIDPQNQQVEIYRGRAEGKAEGIRLVAANLLKSQMSLEEVIKLTGLSIEDVQLLQTEIKGESR
ncbi:hypothetical protein [uncultured Nostoc sp.]|uniref:hypothetical protein n=1 Tax=uncultured Nostoc sp. TaxID=340711 RepID=UPI00261630C7|nr:hypothetical protein [uncultured Nostoc sp.]